MSSFGLARGHFRRNRELGPGRDKRGRPEALRFRTEGATFTDFQQRRVKHEILDVFTHAHCYERKRDLEPRNRIPTQFIYWAL